MVSGDSAALGSVQLFQLCQATDFGANRPIHRRFGVQVAALQFEKRTLFFFFSESSQAHDIAFGAIGWGDTRFR
jgi:hypothetical protein